MDREQYIEEHLKTRVANKCDVLVCGGGIAGIAAALAAARQSKKVILNICWAVSELQGL